MYKPLPHSLTIKTSKVNGLGLFTKEEIPQATNFGMTHFKIGDTIFRTPLGGFINHSNTPNCEKIQLHADSQEPFEKKWNLITRQNIKKGEELTVRYTFYNINDELSIKNTISFKDGTER